MRDSAKYIFLLLYIIMSNIASAQTYNMSNTTITTCNGTFYDPGGSNSTYGNNENVVMTFCSGNPDRDIKLNFTNFSLQNYYDFLYIYEGPDTLAPFLGSYTGIGASNGPGIILSSSANLSRCLTFRLVSNNYGTENGWKADISCRVACQVINSRIISTNPAAQSDSIIRICVGQSVSFVGDATFSKNASGAKYVWDFGDGTTANGKNATKVFSSPGIFRVNLDVSDPNNCANNNRVNQLVYVSTKPNFNGTGAATMGMCLGDSIVLKGKANTTEFTFDCTPPAGERTFLPDGKNSSYTSVLKVDCFDVNAKVKDSLDIQSICMNMEHSFMGDLSISIECPSGKKIPLLARDNNIGKGTIIGNPRATELPADGNSANTTPGIGLTYCFSPDASQFIYDSISWRLLSTYTDVSGNVSYNIKQAIPGNYKINSSWNDFVGCPLNGNWTIWVTDHLAADNGYIFYWNLNFAPSIVPPKYKFKPTIVSSKWLPNPDVISTNGNDIKIKPTSTGSKCFTYRITDNFGCTFDTTVCINVGVGSNPGVSNTLNICGSAAIVNLFTLLGSSASTNGTWTGPSSLGGGYLGAFNPSTHLEGVYVYTVPANGSCPSRSASITVSKGSNNVVGVAITSDKNSICSGTTVTFTATATNGGGSPTYQWKLNGSNVVGSGNTYSSSTLNNNDKIECVLTSNATCATGNPATSNALTMVVNANLPVGVAITSDKNSICSGTTVTFTATATNGGSSPTYQWKLNGSNVSGNSATYTSNTLANNDKIECVLTSNATCATGSPATSNAVTMVVQNTVFAGIDGNITICESDTNQINLFSIINNEQVGGTWYRIEGIGGQFLNLNGIFKSAINATNSKFIYVVQAISPCPNDTSIAIVNINKRTIPTFTSLAPICQYDNVPVLPAISSNGISGSWTPSIIDNTQVGVIQYIFTPNATECATTNTLTVKILTKKDTSVSHSICEGNFFSVCNNNYYEEGQYIVDCKTYQGCDSTVKLNLVVNPKPKINIYANGSLRFCEGKNVALNTSSGLLNYNWYNDNILLADNDSKLFVENTGNYSVAAETEFHCRDTSEIVQVIVDEDFELELGEDIYICSGEEVLIDAVIENAKYFWNTRDTTQTISVNNYGVYTVSVTRGTCSHSDKIGIFRLAEDPVWYLGDDVGLCSGKQITLNAPTTMSFYWDNNTSDLLRTISKEGTYSIAVSNECGVYRDTIFIFEDTCECKLFAPNGFTPNQDIINPYFKIINECPSVAEIKIYNRWGIEVYDGNSDNKGWDGYYKGMLQPEDTYIWIVKYFDKYQNKIITEKGTLLLLK